MDQVDDLSDETFESDARTLNSEKITLNITENNRAKLRNKIKQKKNNRLNLQHPNNNTMPNSLNQQNISDIMSSPMFTNMMKQFGLDSIDKNKLNEEIKNLISKGL